MPRLLRLHHALATLLIAAALGGAFGGARATEAQSPPNAAADADPLAPMREDLRAKRYADVLRRGNDLLGSSRRFTPAEQIQLWQLMAAAYYPPDPRAQQPDSARLPLAALARLSPDARLAPEFSWPGLDSLFDIERGADFRLTVHALEAREASLAEPAYVAASATRPARFRLVTRSSATGVEVVHDTAGPSRSATLRLRVHDGVHPTLANGEHDLRVIAIDASTGDTTVVKRRLRARANTSGRIDPLPPFIPPTTVRGGSLRRSTAIVGGALFAGATVAMASGARAPAPIGSAFSNDSRALVVGGAMLGAAVVSLFLDRGRERPVTERDIARAREEYDRRLAQQLDEARARAARYRVTLTMEAPRP